MRAFPLPSFTFRSFERSQQMTLEAKPLGNAVASQQVHEGHSACKRTVDCIVRVTVNGGRDRESKWIPNTYRNNDRALQVFFCGRVWLQVQGGPSGFTLCCLDIKLRVAFSYKEDKL